MDASLVRSSGRRVVSRVCCVHSLSKMKVLRMTWKVQGTDLDNPCDAL